MPELAADLARRKVALIVAIGTTAAQAAQAETTTIPILFLSAFDPVQLGTVVGFRREGGNATGVALHAAPLALKRLEFLRELAPGVKRMALLVNPTGLIGDIETRDIEAVTRAAGLNLLVLKARHGERRHLGFCCRRPAKNRSAHRELRSLLHPQAHATGSSRGPA